MGQRAAAASGLVPATVRHACRAVFKPVLNGAIDDGLLARSPCHRIELPPAAPPVIEPLAPAPRSSHAFRSRTAVRAARGRGYPGGPSTWPYWPGLVMPQRVSCEPAKTSRGNGTADSLRHS